MFKTFYENLEKTANDLPGNYNRQTLKAELKKNKISFSEKRSKKTIKFKNCRDYVFSYSKVHFGFLIDYKYLERRYSKYLSDSWVSYLKLKEENSIDIIKMKPHKMGKLNIKYYEQWKNKLMAFLSVYPDFALKDKVINEIKTCNEKIEQAKSENQITITQRLKIYSKKPLSIFERGEPLGVRILFDKTFEKF